MRRLVFSAMMLMLALFVLPGIALADNSTPETAIALTPESPGQASRLYGDTGGAVRFYRVDYAGNGQPVAVRLTASPSRNFTGPRFGFKIYGPAGLLGEGQVDANDDYSTRLSLTIASVVPGAYLIQVYNFTEGTPVDFSLTADGLSGATLVSGGAAPPAPANTTAERAVIMTQPIGSLGGVLTGQDGGTFQFFNVEYPGMNTYLQLSMQYSPPSPFLNGAVGFDVYGSDGKRIASANETGRDGSSVTVELGLQDEMPDSLTVQVLNYQPGLAANYVLRVEGAAGAVAEVTGNTTPDRAPLLSADMRAARGTVPAGKDGTFNFFLLSYPGGNKAVSIGIVVDEAAGYTQPAIGINLYKGADAAGTATAALNNKGTKRLAYLVIAQDEAVTFGVQIFNYTNGLPVPYMIHVNGL